MVHCPSHNSEGLPLIVWAKDLFGDCVYSNRELAGLLVGLSSIVCWCFAQMPQVIKNYKEPLAAKSLSVLFIAVWLIGDISNLIGCILTKQLPFQTYLAVYFVFVDSCLLLQWIIAKRLPVEDSDETVKLLEDKDNHDDAEEQDDFVVYERKDDSTDDVVTKDNKDESSSDPSSSSPSTGSGATTARANRKTSYGTLTLSKLTLMLLLSILHNTSHAVPTISRFSFINDTLYSYTDGEDGTSPTPRSVGGIEDDVFVGEFFAWVCLACYITSRLPQIYKNFKSQSVQGLSIYMFIFAALGNTTYMLGIFLKSTELAFIERSLPYILGSGGTLVFDLIIYIQYLMYRPKYTTLNYLSSPFFHVEVLLAQPPNQCRFSIFVQSLCVQMEVPIIPSESEGSEGTPSFVGVILAIVGSSFIGLSYTASKTAHNQILKEFQQENGITHDQESMYASQSDVGSSNEEDNIGDDLEITDEDSHEASTPRYSMSKMAKSPTWWMSIILLLSGEIFNFMAYGFAPTSTIASLGTLSIISGALSGSFYLGERISRRNLVGMMLSGVGAALIVLFSRAEEPHIGPDEILEALSQTRFVIYSSLVSALALFLIFLDTNPIRSNGETVGDKYVVVRVLLTAIFSGFTVLATKSVSSLFTLTLYKLFTFWISYVLFFVLVFTALLTLYYTNKALATFDSTQVLPAEFAAFTISAVLGSAMLYNDFDSATVYQILMFVCGCSIIFCGVYLITSGDDKLKDLVPNRSSMVVLPATFPVIKSVDRHSKYDSLKSRSKSSYNTFSHYVPGNQNSARVKPNTSLDTASITTRSHLLDFAKSPAMVTIDGDENDDENDRLLWYVNDDSFAKRLSRTGLVGLATVINALGTTRASLSFQQIVLKKELEQEENNANAIDSPMKKRRSTKIFIVPDESFSSQAMETRITDSITVNLRGRTEAVAKSPPQFEVISTVTSPDEPAFIIRPINQSSIDMITNNDDGFYDSGINNSMSQEETKCETEADQSHETESDPGEKRLKRSKSATILKKIHLNNLLQYFPKSKQHAQGLSKNNSQK